MKPLTSFTMLTLALALVACGGESRQTAEPKLSSASEVTGPGWPTLGRDEARYIHIDLGPDNFTDCQKLSPKFPFDSADTYAQWKMQLEGLASCLALPEMQDRTLLLVGRADPAGSNAYNDELGMKRAEAIKQILIDNGIRADRIEVISEGKRGALGDTPDYSRGYDRRVDVIVKGGTHLPDR
jgi:outer membrane protein OmpA-like peptidoglycan-associated protein